MHSADKRQFHLQFWELSFNLFRISVDRHSVVQTPVGIIKPCQHFINDRIKPAQTDQSFLKLALSAAKHPHTERSGSVV